MQRPPAASSTEIRFQVQEGYVTNANPAALQFRLACKGPATRSVVDASLTVLGGAVKLA